MGNLGTYQLMTTIAKKVGGPEKLVGILLVGGYVVIRPAEAAARKGYRALMDRVVPCPTKGQVFRATSDGEDGSLKMAVGREFRVLECDGDAVLIEVLGDSGNPYFVSSSFLRSISDFPHDDT